MAGQWKPENLQYYSNLGQAGLLKALVTGTAAGVAAMLCVILLLRIFPLERNWPLRIAGLAGLAILLSVFLWQRADMFRPWCRTCQRRVHIRERLFAIPVTRDVLVNSQASDAVRSLARGDWSLLHNVKPLGHWPSLEEPAILIGLGQCDGCKGPFILFGEIHGKDAKTNTVYAGPAFISEIDVGSVNDLHSIAQQTGLLGPDRRKSP